MESVTLTRLALATAVTWKPIARFDRVPLVFRGLPSHRLLTLSTPEQPSARASARVIVLLASVLANRDSLEELAIEWDATKIAAVMEVALL